MPHFTIVFVVSAALTSTDEKTMLIFASHRSNTICIYTHTHFHAMSRKMSNFDYTVTMLVNAARNFQFASFYDIFVAFGHFDRN